MGNKCIFCGNADNLTDEHIVPEGIGGALTIKAVCKTCNDRMGSDFEGPTINTSLFEALRYVHGITGKRTKPLNPLRGLGTLPNGFKVRFTDALSPHLIPDKKEEQLPDGSVKLSLTLDASDEKDLERILTKMIRRYYRKQSAAMGTQDYEARIAEAVRQAQAELKIGRFPGPIKMQSSVDLAALRLTYLKIAYETCWHHFGDRYLQDAVAMRLCEAINKRHRETKIRGEVLFGDDQLSKVTFSEDCHSVMLIGNACYLCLFGLTGVVETCEESGEFHLRQEDGVIYHYNYVQRSFTITPWVDHLAKYLDARQ